jgi:hypothetical protein
MYATWDNFTGKPVDGYLANRMKSGMQIRLAHTTDAAAVNELLHQLGYAQDGAASRGSGSVVAAGVGAGAGGVGLGGAW